MENACPGEGGAARWQAVCEGLRSLDPYGGVRTGGFSGVERKPRKLGGGVPEGASSGQHHNEQKVSQWQQVESQGCGHFLPA